MDQGIKIYVATWGNPLSWKRVEYNCDEDGKMRGKGVSTIVCAEADLYLVHMLDSAVTAVFKDADKEVLNCAKEAGLSVEPEGKVSPTDWGRLREIVRRYGKCVAKAMGRYAEVVATGSRGRYAGVQYGAATDQIAAELLHGLWSAVDGRFGEELRKAAEDRQSNLQVELTLDVTHGVNFMPAVALYVAPHLASLMLAAGARQVTIKAYNATPEDWHYVKVFSTNIRHLQFPAPPVTWHAKALYLGALLQFAEKCPVRPPDPPASPPTYDGGRVTYKSHAEYQRYYELLLAAVACRTAPSPPTLKRLMKWHLVDVLPPTASAILRDELNDILQALKGAAGEVRLNELDNYKHAKPLNCNKYQDYRNFVAHAGLAAAHITARPTPDGDWELKSDEEVYSCINRLKG